MEITKPEKWKTLASVNWFKKHKKKIKKSKQGEWIDQQEPYVQAASGLLAGRRRKRPPVEATDRPPVGL